MLLVVTDGEDNASRESLEQAIRRLDRARMGRPFTPSASLGEEHAKRARRALREMAEDTGGVAFFPKTSNEVEAITTQIAHDIRNQYTISTSPRPAERGGYRTVKVEASARATRTAGAHAQRILCWPAKCGSDSTAPNKVRVCLA